MTTYKFLVAVDYDRNGKHYEVSEVDMLEDWRKADVKSAMKANLVERIGRITVDADIGTGRSGGGETWLDKQ